MWRINRVGNEAARAACKLGGELEARIADVEDARMDVAR
jgi:hypothetical protein